ncbi:MAG: polyketide synthase dehydratase domain-containing protein [Planctomycetota bacterium]
MATPSEHLRDLRIDEQVVRYPEQESSPGIYHGPSLRALRSIGFGTDPGANQIPIAVGTIVAPSPGHLFGEHRPLSGWMTEPAAMDALLYASGMLAGHVGRRASLPVSIDQIDFGRLPAFGEPLRVVVKWLTADNEGTGGVMTALLIGQNDDRIAELTGYRIAWLPKAATKLDFGVGL